MLVLYCLGLSKRSDCVIYSDVICITSALKIIVQAERMSSYRHVLKRNPLKNKQTIAHSL